MVVQQNQRMTAVGDMLAMVYVNSESKGCHTGEAEFLGREQRADALQRELGQVSLDDFLVAERLGDVLLGITANLIENVHGEPGLGLVLVGNPVDCSNGFILATTGEQELGGLIEMEQEEAADEHDNSQGAHSEHEVSPAHIVVLSAAGDSVTDYVAGGQVIRAAISGNEAPGNKTSGLLDDLNTHNSKVREAPT
jgi:hypothetical protein